MFYAPKYTGDYIVSVTSSAGENTESGKYSIVYKEAPKKLNTYSKNELYNDFDILKNAYLETRVGLWYNSKVQFDSLCNLQRLQIKDKMNALDFYRILAPIVAFTKEGHSNISFSSELEMNASRENRLFPFLVKILNGKVYIINDFENYKTKGLEIRKINGKEIDEILQKFLSIEPSDGFNVTSKNRWIEGAFSKYYARFFEHSTLSFSIELVNPSNNEKINYDNIKSLNSSAFNDFKKKAAELIPNYSFKDNTVINIDENTSTATLTFNSFLIDNFFRSTGRDNFQKKLEETFKNISDKKIKNVIIDIFVRMRVAIKVLRMSYYHF
jgi:hypothetical protein